MIRTQIQLTEYQAKTLKLLAGKEGVSMAELIRVSIDRYLREAARDAESDRLAKAKEAVGKYGCGLSDLAANHDRYFAGEETK